MMTVAQMIREKLDELGADGLMYPEWEGTKIIVIKEALNCISENMVPAFRHADGTYHAEPDKLSFPCEKCVDYDGFFCDRETGQCAEWHRHQSWLSHKEAK